MQNPNGAWQIPTVPSAQRAHQLHQQAWRMMQQHRQSMQDEQQEGWNQQYYGGGSQNRGPDNEIRSLWIGNLKPWMDERYVMSIFRPTREAISAKVIRNKQTGECEGYGFIEFANHAAAERVLSIYSGTPMPNCEQALSLNWAQDRGQAEGPEYTIFVGGLAPDVTDYVMTKKFTNVYESVKGARVVTDRATGQSKGYGFVWFGDEREQMRAMREMNGQYCLTRPMRTAPAANKMPLTMQPVMNQDTQGGNPGESDPSNTTIFVGALDASVTDDELRVAFGQLGEVIHVEKLPRKRFGFVQYANRASAELALLTLNGTTLGGQIMRLSWSQPDQAQ